MAAWAGILNGDFLVGSRGSPTRSSQLPTTSRTKQNTAKLPLGIVVLGAPSNKSEDIRPLIPEILEMLKTL